MALTDGEAARVYTELRDVLASAGLGWLVREVELEIHAGRLTMARLHPPERPSEDVRLGASHRRGRAADFVVAETYSSADRLQLLVDAVEAVAVGLPLAAMDCLSFVPANKPGVRSLGFAPDAPDSEMVEVPFAFAERAPAVDALMKLLRELREAI